MPGDAEQSIPPLQSYDPFPRILTQALRLSPLSLGLALFIADLIVGGWLGWRYNVFLSTSETPGLLQDLTALATEFVSIPVIAGVYLWTLPGATELFRYLYKSPVFKSETRLVEIVDKSRPLFRNRAVFYITLVLSLLYALSQVSAYMGWVPWRSASAYLELYPPMSFVRAPFWFFNFYTLLYCMFNVTVTVITLRRLFRTREIEVLPLHPDQSGGLRSISQYSIKIAYAIGAAGLVISAATVFEIQHGTLFVAFPIIVGIVAYIVFAPFFFFWPLGTAHEAMQEAKETELLRLAQEFERVYDRVKQDDIEHSQGYENDMKRLEHLKQLYEIGQEFPVWPFDTRNLRRFFAVVTTPLLPAIISVITEFITNLFKFK